MILREVPDLCDTVGKLLDRLESRMTRGVAFDLRAPHFFSSALKGGALTRHRYN